MKKYIAILILILFCQAGYSQSMDKLFNDFAKQKNVNQYNGNNGNTAQGEVD